MTPIQLAEIEERANMAAEGPWVEVFHEGTNTIRSRYEREIFLAIPTYDMRHNIDFVLNARQDISDLLAEVERLQTRIAEMEAQYTQLNEQRAAMEQAAEEYYRILKQAPAATPGEIERLKNRLDELAAPFSDNIAYHTFLRMERTAAGL